MSKTKIRLEYCGMSGEGATVREAKMDAANKIEGVLSMDFTPRVIIWKGRMAVIWNTPTGVHSGYLTDSGKICGTCLHFSDETVDAASEGIRYALAQWGADIGCNDIPEVIAHNDRRVRDYREWLGFQRAYRHAQNETPSMPENQLHRFACDNAPRFTPKAA